MRYSLPQPFEEIDHTADVGVRVGGATVEETLARLVLAYAQLAAGGAAVTPERDERIEVEYDGDLALLAYDTLRALVYRLATDRILPAACEVAPLAAPHASLDVAFGRFDPVQHAEGLDIKAVTLHGARFEATRSGYQAEVVFDV